MKNKRQKRPWKKAKRWLRDDGPRVSISGWPVIPEGEFVPWSAIANHPKSWTILKGPKECDPEVGDLFRRHIQAVLSGQDPLSLRWKAFKEQAKLSAAPKKALE